MAIDFPASPSTNDTFTAGSITYKWDGAKWVGMGVTPADRLVEGGNKLEINASNDLTWTGNNFGIGTDIPAEKLEVYGNARFKQTDGSHGIEFYPDVASLGYQRIISFNRTSSAYEDLSIGVNDFIVTTGSSDERLRVDSNGRIGIGASNNTSYDTNAQNVLIASDGNTGITIRSAGATPFAMIHFADGVTDNSEKRAGRIVYQHDGDNMMFNTANEERLRISGTGYLGVNIQNPTGLIDVRSEVATDTLGVIFRKDFDGAVADDVSKLALTVWGQDHDDAISGTGTDRFGPMIGFGARNDDTDPNVGDVRAGISYDYNGGLSFHAKSGSNSGLGITDGSHERLRINGEDGSIEAMSGTIIGKFYTASGAAELELTDWTASTDWRVIEVFGISNPNNLGSNYMDPIHVYLYHGYGWNGSALTSYLYLQDQAPLARSVFPSGSGGSANSLTVEWYDGSSAVSGTTGVAAGSGAYYPRLTTAQMGNNSNFQVRVIRRF